MKTSKMSGYIVTMLAIGAVFFSALGWLVNWRTGSPLPTSGSRPLAGTILQRPESVLMQGVRQSVSSALTELEHGHRTKAVMAIDAAKRAADVGRHGTSGDLASGFDHIHREMEHVRASLQDGERTSARRLLAATTAALSLEPTGRPGATGLSTAPAPESDLNAYAGAHVINAQGVRIGEVVQIRSGQALLEIGGNDDVLGFIDLGGGKQISVPVEKLVFGKRKALGSTMVALPTFSVSGDQVELEFGKS